MFSNKASRFVLASPHSLHSLSHFHPLSSHISHFYSTSQSTVSTTASKNTGPTSGPQRPSQSNQNLDSATQEAIKNEEEDDEYKTIENIPAFSLHQLARFLPRGWHSSLSPRDEYRSLTMLYEENAREKEDLKNKRKMGGASFREMGANIVGQDSRGVNRKKIYAALDTEELKEMWHLDKERKLKKLHEEEEHIRRKEENMKELEKKFQAQTGQKPPPSAMYPQAKFGRDSKISKKKRSQRDREQQRLVTKFASGALEDDDPEDNKALQNYKNVVGIYRSIYRLVKRRLYDTSPDQFQSTMHAIRRQFRKGKYLKDDDEITEAIHRGEEYVVRLTAYARARGQEVYEQDDSRIVEKDRKLSRYNRVRKYWNRYFKQVGSMSETYCRYPQLHPYLESLGLDMDSQVLVVGGGVSQACLGMVRDFGCSVTTIDISNVAMENMIRWTKSVPAVHFVHGDAGRMENHFPNGSFDMVFDKGCLDTILSEEGDDAYIESQRMLLEIWRVLQNGGVYFLVTTMPDAGVQKQFVFMDWILTKVGETKMNTVTDEIDETTFNEATYKFWTIKKPEDAPSEIPDFAEFEEEYHRMKEQLGK